MTVLSKEEFEKRELVTRVHMDRGDVVEVRMPLMLDVMPFIQEGGTQSFINKLVCAACNLEMDEYLHLSYIDGMKILEPIGLFLSALQKYKESIVPVQRAEKVEQKPKKLQ